MVERGLAEFEQRRARGLRAVCELEAASCRRVSRAASSGSVDSARCPRPLRVPGAGTHTQATPTGASSRLWRSPSRARRADAGRTPSARTRAQQQLPAARGLEASAWRRARRADASESSLRSGRGDLNARFTDVARIAKRGRIRSSRRRGRDGVTAKSTDSSRPRVPLRDKLLRASAEIAPSRMRTLRSCRPICRLRRASSQSSVSR